MTSVVIVEHDAISDELLELVAEVTWWDEVDQAVEDVFERIVSPLSPDEAVAILRAYHQDKPW